MGKDKTQINIVVIFHVDSGDSEITHNLIDKLALVDGKFETSNYFCTIIDAPEQADCAVLVIDSTTSVSIQAKDELIQHTLAAFALGRKHLICCCKEMQAAFSKDQYDEIVREASSYLKSLGYDQSKITFVPISGSEGDNVIERSTNLEWYKGPTLHEAIDQINGPKRPLREDHKTCLQEFTLKKYQRHPVYITRSEGERRDLKFWSTVEVDGQRFESVQLHLRKKEAEQDAAKVAYEFLVVRGGDNFADVLALIDKDMVLCKTILYEFATKKKIDQPSYSWHRQKGPGSKMTFNVATVSVAGKEYIGEIGISKKNAAEKAARLAVKSILDTNDECMLKTIRSKRRLIAAGPYSLYYKEGVPNFPGVLSIPSNQPSKKRTIETSAPDPEASPGLVASSITSQDDSQDGGWTLVEPIHIC